MHSQVALVVVLLLATPSATELIDDGIDVSVDKNGEHDTVETFGSRGSGFSELSLDNPSDAYYHHERSRIARAVLEEEGSSSLDSDLLIDVEQTTRNADLRHTSTPPPKTIPKTTTRQVIYMERIFKRRSLLAINFTNSPISFDHRSSVQQPEGATVQNPKTTKTVVERTTLTAVPETDQSTRYDDLPLEEDGFLPHIYRRTRRRGDTFDPTASVQTDPPFSTAPATETAAFTSSITERVTELFSVESSTDDNVATSIQNTPAKNDAYTSPVTHTYAISNAKTDSMTSVTHSQYNTLSENNKNSKITPSASAVLITQSVPQVTDTTGGTPAVNTGPTSSTHMYTYSTHLNFVDPKICTHTPDDTFNIDLFHEVLFSRVDCSGHVAIFGDNVTLDSGLSASLFLTIYKRLQLGGLIMSRLADELNDYIYRPADFI